MDGRYPSRALTLPITHIVGIISNVCGFTRGDFGYTSAISAITKRLKWRFGLLGMVKLPLSVACALHVQVKYQCMVFVQVWYLGLRF